MVNLFLIAAIVLLPFSTSAVGDPGIEDLPLPTVIMAVNVVAASLLHTLVYVVAVRRNLLSTAPTRVRSRISSSTRLRARSSSPPRCRSPT